MSIREESAIYHESRVTDHDSHQVGLLGGSFDPPHMGHVMLCACGLVGLGLEEVWMVPCRSHPFGKPLSPFADRVAMCRLAVAAMGSRVRVDPIEQSLGDPDQPSYTVDTLAAIKRQHPDRRFRLLVGSDVAGELDKWHEADRVRELAPPLIVPRMGFRSDQRSGESVGDLSSTVIRQRVREGLSLEGLVPCAVTQFIAQRRLYRGAVVA